MRLVLKIGGSLDGAGTTNLAKALRGPLSRGCEVVLVHGGGPAISRRLVDAGIHLPFVDGLRITTDEAINIVVDALRECNEALFSGLRAAGLPVESLLDGGTILARDIGQCRTGEIASVASAELRKLCSAGKIPLLPPYGLDAQGRWFNLNADFVAGAVAEAWWANRLVYCTDVAGVYADYSAGERLFDTTTGELEALLSGGRFSDGMIPKVRAMLYASRCGVDDVWVVDGRDGESLCYAVATAEEQVSNPVANRGTRLQTNRTKMEARR